MSLVSVISKVAKAISRKYDIEVVIKNGISCTDGKRLFLDSKYFLYVGETKDFHNGIIDHEVGHLCYSIFPDELEERARKLFENLMVNKIAQNLEDMRVNQKMVERFEGSTIFFMEKVILTEHLKRMTDILPYPKIYRLCLAIRTVTLHQFFFQKFFANDPIVNFIDDVYKKNFLYRHYECKDTNQVIYLAKEIYDSFVEYMKQQQDEEDDKGAQKGAQESTDNDDNEKQRKDIKKTLNDENEKRKDDGKDNETDDENEKSKDDSEDNETDDENEKSKDDSGVNDGGVNDGEVNDGGDNETDDESKKRVEEELYRELDDINFDNFDNVTKDVFEKMEQLPDDLTKEFNNNFYEADYEIKKNDEIIFLQKEYEKYIMRHMRIRKKNVSMLSKALEKRFLSKRYKSFSNKMNKSISYFINTFVHKLFSKSIPFLYESNDENGSLNLIEFLKTSSFDGYESKNLYFSEEQSIFNGVACYLLIDISGSMSYLHKIENATMATIAIAEALKRVNVPFEIAAHHTKIDFQYSYSKNYNIGRIIPNEYIIVKSFDDIDLRYISTLPLFASCGNVDGKAMEIAKERLESRIEKRKIMFMLTDGNPTGYHNDEVGIKHMKDVYESIVKSGIEFYAIGINMVYKIFPEKSWFNFDVENFHEKLVKIISEKVLW